MSELIVEVKGLGQLNEAKEAIDKGANATKSLRAQLKELQAQLASGQLSGEEFTALAAKAGELRDRMKDASEAVNAQAAPAFERLGNNAGLLGQQLGTLDFGGAATSVRGLAGAVGNISFKELGTEIKSFMGSLAQLGKALLTNPIFLIGATIAAIVMNFDSLKAAIPGVNEALTGVSEEMTVALEASKQMTEQSMNQLKFLSESENQLKLQGKSEREILDLKIKASEQALIDLKAQMEQQKIVAKAQIETAERNKEITKGILQFITLPLQGILFTIDKIAEFAGFETNLREGLNEAVSSLLFDPEEVKKEADATQKELEKQYNQLAEQQAGFKLQVQQMDKRENDARLAAQEEFNKKRLASEKNYRLALQKVTEEIDAAIRLAEDQKNQSEITSNDERIKMLEDQKALREELTMSEQEKEINAVDAKYIALREKAHGNAELMKILAEQNQAEVDAIEDKYAKKKLEREQAVMDAKIAGAISIVNALTTINDSFSKSDERGARRAFQRNKSLQIVQALMSTYQGVNAIFTAAALNPASILFPAQPYIAAGAALTAGLANVNNIRKQQFNPGGGGGGTGGGGGGAGAPSFGGGGGGGTGVPTFNPINTAFLNNREQPAPARAYVLTTDIVSQQQARQRVEDQSTL